MSKPVTLDPTVEQQMRQYADEANENHRAAMDAEASALQYARAAGDALRQAKQLVPYGGWLAWLDANFKASTKTATDYMRISEAYDGLLRSGSQPTSIRHALERLKRRRPSPSVSPDESSDYADMFPQEAQEQLALQALQKDILSLFTQTRLGRDSLGRVLHPRF